MFVIALMLLRQYAENAVIALTFAPKTLSLLYLVGAWVGS
jgi:hypothetical protein